MNYRAAIAFLYSRLPFYSRSGSSAIKPGLKNIQLLCNALKNPQNSFKTIHIAGTNGKGSVSAFLSSILKEKKISVGTYTSPHLIDFRERIVINGKPIGKNFVVRFLKENMPLIETVSPSFFELSFVMALEAFKQKKVEIAVIETGLGGRLDSTNIIHPLLSIITNIDLEHTKILGDTKGKIAAEKAGIIKYKTPVLIGEKEKETTPVFLKKAEKEGAPIYFSDEIVTMKEKKNDILSFSTHKNELYSFKEPFKAQYQEKNIQTVLSACMVLNRGSSLSLSKRSIKKGIEKVRINTGLKGRWQFLSNSPKIICDTGHNPAAFQYITSELKALKADSLFFLLSFVEEKDIDAIFSILPKNAHYFLFELPIERACKIDTLKKMAEKHTLSVKTGNHFPTLYKTATKLLKKNDVLFIGGSTFLVGKTLEYLQRFRKK